MRNIYLKGVNLKGSICEYANFQMSNLENAKLSNS